MIGQPFNSRYIGIVSCQFSDRMIINHQLDRFCRNKRGKLEGEMKEEQKDWSGRIEGSDGGEKKKRKR